MAGTHGATVNPIGQLEWLEAMAASKAYLTSSSLVTEVAMAHIGTRGPGGRTTQAYLARFWMPSARRGGFRNRITGRHYPTPEEALDADAGVGASPAHVRAWLPFSSAPDFGGEIPGCGSLH